MRCRMARPHGSHIRICCEREVGRSRHKIGTPAAGARLRFSRYWPSLVESGRVTRRAPPLEVISRHTTTQQSVHRLSGRWTVLLLVLGLTTLLVSCQVMPEVQFARRLPLSRSTIPIDVVSPDGTIGRAASLRASRKLSNTGDTNLLDYHLAAMRDLGAPPLLSGNGVELLVDGPETYRSMFAAIEQAREYILVESFIFEEAIQGDRTLSDLLRQATARGVHIYVLYDAIGSLTTDAEFLAGLKQGGISLCAFNPLNPLDARFDGLNQRDHRKIVVIDGYLAFA